MADQLTPPPVPPSAFAQAPRTAPIAIWSLVLAILSFFCGWLFTAIPAVICGRVARWKIRKSGGALSGIPALQDEVSGTQSGTNVVFLHTTVDEGDYFQQILAWTLKSRWQEQNEQLREITKSFHSK
jgi:hypothetical protein